MIKKKSVEDTHNLIRYVREKHLIRDPETEQIELCIPDAWFLRANESYLSVTWVEFFGHCCQSTIESAISSFQDSFIGWKPEDAYLLVSILDLIDLAETCGEKVKIHHIPTGRNQAHSGIRGIKDDKRLAQCLSENFACFVNFQPASGLPAESTPPDSPASPSS